MAKGGRILLVAVEHDGFGEQKGPPYEASIIGETVDQPHVMSTVCIKYSISFRGAFLTGLMKAKSQIWVGPQSRWRKLMCKVLRLSRRRHHECLHSNISGMLRSQSGQPNQGAGYLAAIFMSSTCAKSMPWTRRCEHVVQHAPELGGWVEGIRERGRESGASNKRDLSDPFGYMCFCAGS